MSAEQLSAWTPDEDCQFQRIPRHVFESPKLGKPITTYTGRQRGPERDYLLLLAGLISSCEILRQVRILSVGIVRASHDSCNNAADWFGVDARMEVGCFSRIV